MTAEAQRQVMRRCSCFRVLLVLAVIYLARPGSATTQQLVVKLGAGGHRTVLTSPFARRISAARYRTFLAPPASSSAASPVLSPQEFAPSQLPLRSVRRWSYRLSEAIDLQGVLGVGPAGLSSAIGVRIRI